MPRQKKQKLIGLGLPANLLKEFIDFSYKGNTSIAPEGYEIDAPLSDSRVKVYKKIGSNQVIIVHRGSVGSQDWLDNMSYIVRGKVKGTKSFNLHKERQLKAVEKYGKDNNLIGLAHSRGGLYLQELQKDPATKLNEIVTYNKAVGFYDALRSNPDEQTDVKVKNDFVSLLSGLQKRKNKMVEIDATSNPLDFNKAHQAAEIDKLGDTFIGKKEEEKPMIGSGRAPSPKTLEELNKMLKTLEKQLININKGKVYKTTNKDKVEYELSYTKARIKNYETKGEDLIITKKEKYGNELPAKAKPYKAKEVKPKKEEPKPEPKKEEPKPKKEEPKKEEPKKEEPRKKEDIKKEDFKDMWDYYSALWFIPNPNRPNKGLRKDDYYNDFHNNISNLGWVENPRKTTYKGFEEITNKEALNILIELRERLENYLKTGEYGKYMRLAEVKKLLEMIEKPIEEHTKYLNKKEEPITNPKLAKIEEFINDTENYLNKKSTRSFNAFMKKYDDKNFIKSIIGAQKFSDFYPTSQKCLSNYKPYLKNISEDDIILEPTAGLGSIVLWLLKNNVKSKIIATDYDPIINNYLKESFAGINQVSILEHSKSDYLAMNNTYYKYNPSIIFLNPPFSNKGDKKYYLNFLFKALYDLKESEHPWREHQLFFISPKLTNSNEKIDESINFEDIVMSANKKKEIKKMLNINDEEEWEDLMPDQVEKVADCNDFGGTKMEATLYHIIIFGNPSKKEEPKPAPKKEEPKPAPKKEEPEIEIDTEKLEALTADEFKKYAKSLTDAEFKEIETLYRQINAEEGGITKKHKSGGYDLINANISDEKQRRVNIKIEDNEDIKKLKNFLLKQNRTNLAQMINAIYKSNTKYKVKRPPASMSIEKIVNYTIDNFLLRYKDIPAQIEAIYKWFNEKKKAKMTGGIFGFSDKEKADKAERKMLREEYFKTHNKQQNANYNFDKSARDKWKKQFYKKNTAPKADITMPKADITMPKADDTIESAQQGIDEGEQEMLGSGMYYLKEIIKPTNPIFKYKRTFEIPTFIDPETEFLMGGAFTDMMGMNCNKEDGTCFNPVWERRKIRSQILSEYKIWYNPFAPPPPGTIRMAWLNPMIEQRFKPIYDEFVARRNVNIGLPANASRDRFAQQMFSNLTDGLSYVPGSNIATAGLTLASALSDTKKEDGT